MLKCDQKIAAQERSDKKLNKTLRNFPILTLTKPYTKVKLREMLKYQTSYFQSLTQKMYSPIADLKSKYTFSKDTN